MQVTQTAVLLRGSAKGFKTKATWCEVRMVTAMVYHGEWRQCLVVAELTGRRAWRPFIPSSDWYARGERLNNSYEGEQYSQKQQSIEGE